MLMSRFEGLVSPFTIGTAWAERVRALAIPRIVVTGGPCAGKTSAMVALVAWAVSRGYVPLIVPEAATVLITAGLDPRSPEFQEAVIDHVIMMDMIFLRQAELLQAHGMKPLLIHDRGLFDQLAYMSEADFFALAKSRGIEPTRVRNEWYLDVIFMRSAAVGAEEFYDLASNVARYETLEEARALDERTLHAWVGRTTLRQIDNVPGQSFADKINRVVASVARALGEPAPVDAERAYLLRNFSVDQLPLHTVASDIVQTYLVNNSGNSERVRARGQNNVWAYTHTVKEPRAAGVTIKHERIIDRRDYDDFLVRRDPLRSQVHKTRHCFVYADHYCEVDVYHGEFAGEVRLQIKVPIEQMVGDLFLPPFLDIEREITNDLSLKSRVPALQK
jgi:CYTH domain-containing protein/predicted ATPase